MSSQSLYECDFPLKIVSAKTPLRITGSGPNQVLRFAHQELHIPPWFQMYRNIIAITKADNMQGVRPAKFETMYIIEGPVERWLPDQHYMLSCIVAGRNIEFLAFNDWRIPYLIEMADF